MLQDTQFFDGVSNQTKVSFEINPRSKHLKQRQPVSLSDMLEGDKLVRSYVSLLSKLREYEPDIDNPMPPSDIRAAMRGCINSLYLPRAYKRSLGVEYLSRKEHLSKPELELLDKMLKAIFKEPTEQYMNYVYGLSKYELVEIKSKGRWICKYLHYSPHNLQKRITQNMTDDSCYNFDFELLTWVGVMMLPFCRNRVFESLSDEKKEDLEDLLSELNYELVEKSFRYLFETAGRRVALKLSLFDKFNLDPEPLLGGDFRAWETLIADREHFLSTVPSSIDK